jgi:hypothetical protein
MVKKYDNEFKVILVGLLQSELKAKQVSDDYDMAECLQDQIHQEGLCFSL